MATLTFTLPFPHPVHCERGWWGHSGCTDHAPGPEKQHGRCVSQGQQPGEPQNWAHGAMENGVGRRVRLAHNLGVWAEAPECFSGKGWETCRKMRVLAALTFRLGNQV